MTVIIKAYLSTKPRVITGLLYYEQPILFNARTISTNSYVDGTSFTELFGCVYWEDLNIEFKNMSKNTLQKIYMSEITVSHL